MDSDLHEQLHTLRQWRENVIAVLGDYRAWLLDTGSQDAMLDLRLFDMMETMRRDRIMLAFIAEFSRGKTETINALFFADFNQRLLPSEAGRTTMCPTEIFWNAEEEPYIRLLPIETRKRDDSLTYLKSHSQEWVKIRLDMHSPDAMRESLQTVAQQKEVSLAEAEALGLWDAEDIAMTQGLANRGTVTVPTWRHAMINYPHSLLESGLVILDTPGLNTLGAEPELTLGIIAHAHAVIFLLATDTGVTKSDMHIWTEHIRKRASRKLAVLNKIDILWDDLKTEEEVAATIRSQVESTARQLGLPTSSVLAISAQKALLAKIKQDEALLHKSGLREVEALLANSVVATKHELISQSVISESTVMLKASRRLMQQRLIMARQEYDELLSMRHASDADADMLFEKLDADRQTYNATMQTFNAGQQKIAKLGERLLAKLNPHDLARILEISKEEIGESWTTAGLNKGMRKLVAQTAGLALRISEQALLIRKTAEELYVLFKTQHGLDAGAVSKLEMQTLLDRMDALQQSTQVFCTDPVNLMTEKRFLVRRFFHSIGNEAQTIFAETSDSCKAWLSGVLKPLIAQIAEHKASLDQRSAAIREIHQNRETLEAHIQKALQKLEREKGLSASLDQMLLKLMKAAKPATQKASPPPSPVLEQAPALAD